MTKLTAVCKVPIPGHLCGILGLSVLLEAFHSDLEFYSICNGLNVFISTPALPLTFRNVVLSTNKWPFLPLWYCYKDRLPLI